MKSYKTRRGICGIPVYLLIAAWLLHASAARALCAPPETDRPKPIVAIDNVCAWPNLKQLPGGELLAFIFNQPCHGKWEGDVECWASGDGGRSWKLRGVPAPHEPGTNRMNIAVGLARSGDLVVIASGYGERPKPGTPAKSYGVPLANWICRSADGGRTWKHAETVRLPQRTPALIPFGDILQRADGTLAAAFYSAGKFLPEGTPPAERFDEAVLLTSHDDGHTWGADPPVRIARHRNETALLARDDKHWLAASRAAGGDRALQLFLSDDAGATWRDGGRLTEPAQIPAHLLALADGRTLLTFGSRTRKYWGVGYRLSGDGGRTWTEPVVLVDFGKTGDGGYPSSVQLADGTIVTAYYAGPSTLHPRYHMGVVRWHAP